MKRLVVFIMMIMLTLSMAFSALAAGETLKVVDITRTGCNSINIQLLLATENYLPATSYRVNTQVTVDGLVYMNELTSMTSLSILSWLLYPSFTAGAVPNQGTWPLPAGHEVVVDIVLMDSDLNFLHQWRTILDSCDTGNILYNAEPAPPPTPTPLDPIDAACRLEIPEGSVVGEAPYGAQIYYEPGHSTPLHLNPGTYIVTGQDESETYYQIVLSCENRWVLKSDLQPSYQAPQNGTPLPTRIIS